MEFPTVTSENLAKFHREHFGKGPSLHATNPMSYEPQEVVDEYDDGLGYYDDGVKRTLTDEQVAIFRHSEIQELLKERMRLRRRKRKNRPGKPEESASEHEPPAKRPLKSSQESQSGLNGSQDTGIAPGQTLGYKRKIVSYAD